MLCFFCGSPRWSSMDNNRLYCPFIVLFYKITKLIDYNPSEMDYNPSTYHINIIHYNRL